MQSQLPLRVAFAGLWCAADREGRFRWRPNQLKLDILPYDQVDMARVLDALSTHRSIVRYASSTRGPHVVDAPPDGDCGFIPSWRKHQIINNRESASKLPVLIKWLKTLIKLTRQSRVSHTWLTRPARGLCTHKGKGKGKKKKKRKRRRARAKMNQRANKKMALNCSMPRFPTMSPNR